MEHYANAFALVSERCFRMIQAENGTGHAQHCLYVTKRRGRFQDAAGKVAHRRGVRRASGRSDVGPMGPLIGPGPQPSARDGPVRLLTPPLMPLAGLALPLVTRKLAPPTGTVPTHSNPSSLSS
jgi:hypothetical protein